MAQRIAKQDFSEWYNSIIYKTEMVDQSPTRGCAVIRPYGYALWEAIQKEVDTQIKKVGVQNAYFPLLIPESFLKKEAEHIEGFAPELAVVTHGGGKELEEPYVVRPTSETIIYDSFSRWIKSYRDLPLKINQWANVIRWEMRSRPFLRTTEFLWQEGHTAHAGKEEALIFAKQILEIYRQLAEDFLAIPVITSEKTANERFPGAETTLTFEGLMQDGRALQMGTSHLLALSFPASFDVKFQDEAGAMQTPWCTSWAVTTRLIGAIVMVHGDTRGLVMPPKIAPIQVVIVPIGKVEQQPAVQAQAETIKADLEKAGIRVHIDNREERPGAKFFHWEERGVPLRIELGARDMESQQVVMVDRLADENAKQTVPWATLTQTVIDQLASLHTRLFDRAAQFRQDHWFKAETLADIAAKIEDAPGIYQTGWCGKTDCELELKTVKASVRCLWKTPEHKNCFACGAASTGDILVAKSY